ncbi:hypothetical protein Moror_9360 [Moniliophthora roreri MCA 2997]|uniref:Uncharacterized protein n=2 Tax=Moniliophthora roreri TaxID=221103 RepID=V2Y362_MONRO|nr:hypothetical protein Moror_9360 [Moniliophthora roreri MCA 2997]
MSTQSDKLILKDVVWKKIQELNRSVWEDSTSGSLMEEDFFIWFPGNDTLEDCTEYDTLETVYDVTWAHSTKVASWFKGPMEVSQTRHHANTSNTVSLVIMVVLKMTQIEQWDGPVPSELGGKPKAEGWSIKRKLEVEGESATQSSVRRKLDALLQSTFHPWSLVSVTAPSFATAANPIMFQSIKLAFEKVTKLESGHVDITWNTEDVRNVQLATEPFAHSMSKIVYKMRVGTEAFVAK